MRRSSTDHHPDSEPARERSGSGSLHVGKGRTAADATPSLPGDGLPLPHERDQATGSAGGERRDPIAQAKRDLDAGLVETDMRATAGLDAERRQRLVPGPGGVPPRPR
jgi:hypothetical protein